MKYTSRRPVEVKRCRGCNKRFETKNPRKEFHDSNCRVRNWAKFNKDKIAIIQKRCRKNADDDLINTYRVLD